MKKDKRIETSIVEILALFFSIVGLVFSFIAFRDSKNTRPLIYYVNPTDANIIENGFECSFDLIVTNGCIDSVKLLYYAYGETVILEDLYGLNLSESDAGYTFEKSYIMDPSSFDFSKPYYVPLYLLVKGEDGSKDLSIILYHVSPDDNTVYRWFLDYDSLCLAEHGEFADLYDDVFASFRELTEYLKEQGELA